jgi:protein tyrosine/serine phosphatase
VNARINTIWQRLNYGVQVFFWDHGMFRALYWNKAQIAPGVYRSNYPTPARIKRLKRQGVQTILSLRGDFDGAFNAIERDACERYGVTLDFAPLAAREAPTKDRIFVLLNKFKTINKPFLMHCKSGADRASLASAIYLIAIEGKSVAEARKMFSMRFIHFKWTKTGILDMFLDMYEERLTQGVIPFQDWVTHEYDAEALTRKFAQRRVTSR